VTTSVAPTSHPLALASAGVGMIAVSFGMARYGFGLLAPDIRSSFGLTSGSLGVLAAASYIAYLAATVTAGVLSAHLGARAIVGAGGACAVAGMTIAGLAQSPPALFAGLLVAGASAGLVFPPFSDIVARRFSSGQGGRILSAISSGTGWGVALAAPMALLAGADWRLAWLLFALAATAATGWALSVLPGREEAGGPAGVVVLRPRWFVCPRSGPLLASGLLVGLASSVFWTFSVDHLATDGGLSPTYSRIFLAVVGVASVGGTLGGDAVRRLGGRATFTVAVAVEAAALLLLGLAPGHPGATMASAVMFGAAYNVVVAVQVIWSARVYRERPSAGLAATVAMNALGLLLGPPLLGAVADHTGFAAVFVAAAGLASASAALAPREPLD
jgi:predicted MFS family arabinose efflux permease